MSDDLDRLRAANYRYVVAALDRLHKCVTHVNSAPDDAALAAAAAELGGPSALDVLADAFGLDTFERDVVLLCAGFEVDGRFAATATAATVGLALTVLPGGSWSAFQESAPLRRWGLVELAAGPPLVAAPLTVAADVLGFVLGQGVPGEDDVLRQVAPPPQPPASQRRAADAVVNAARGLLAAADLLPAVELRGAGVEERRVVAALLADALGTELYVADVRDLPPTGPDLTRVLREWSRRAVLADRCLLVEVGADPEPADRDRVRAVVALVPGPVVVSSPETVVAAPLRPVVRHDVPWPDAGERLELWHSAYARATGAEPADDLTGVADEYRLGPTTITAVCAEALAEPDLPFLPAVQEACRRRTRAQLDGLADRVEVAAATRLVLPERARADVDEFAGHVAHAHDVARQWGGRHALPGVAALFAGPSGTGKTLAAADVARRVGLDLYRVDLSLIVSKYVGETEKNIRRVFEGADAGGVILLFDEADALFGKRGDVKDSHDRYANLEVAYLLQRMEQARTPTILTTNLAESIDPAFLRRLRFVVEFPFPDEAARHEMWRNVFPPGTPTADLDHGKLARLAVNGAAIRDIALRATFLAAREHGPVTMRLLLESARRELRKAERDLPAHEVGDWA